MIKFFQSSIVLQGALVLLVLVLLWLQPLMAPPAIELGEHPAWLYALLCTPLQSVPLLAVILAMLLVLAEGILLNLLLANLGLVPQNSLLPTLLYILALSANATTLTPTILACGCLVAALNQLLLRSSPLTIPPERICGATILISLASLCYQPAILFVVSYLLIAANYRLYTWRDWALMILGLAAPYATLVLILYLMHGLAPWWQQTLATFQFILPQLHTALPALFASIFLVGILLWSLLFTAGRLNERPAVWQKNATTVMLLTVGAIPVMLYNSTLSLAYCAIPFAFCTSRLLLPGNENHTSFRRKKHKHLINDIILIVIIVASFLC